MTPDALVLAAGKSTRISPVSGGRPKPLLEIGGRPIIEWTLAWLAASGTHSVWINLHHRPELIRRALGDGGRFGLEIRYSLEPEILGTAGAWKKLEAHWRGTSLVVYGDNLMRFDLAQFLEAHRARGAMATVALFDRARHRNTGIAGGHAVLDAEGRITAFREGAPPEGDAPWLVNAGAYLLEPEVLERIPPGFQDFGHDVFPTLLSDGGLYGHVLEPEGFCLGLDTPECFSVGQQLIEAGKVQLS